MATEHILIPRQKYEQLTMAANSNNAITDLDTSKEREEEEQRTSEKFEKKDDKDIRHYDEDSNDDYPSATDSDDSRNSELYKEFNVDSDITDKTDSSKPNSLDKKKKKKKKKKMNDRGSSTEFSKKRTRDDIIPRPPGIMKKDIDIGIAKRRSNMSKPKHKKNNIKRWIKW